MTGATLPVHRKGRRFRWILDRLHINKQTSETEIAEFCGTRFLVSHNTNPLRLHQNTEGRQTDMTHLDQMKY